MNDHAEKNQLKLLQFEKTVNRDIKDLKDMVSNIAKAVVKK